MSVSGTLSPIYCAFWLFYAMPWSDVQSSEPIVIAFIKLLGQNFVFRYPRAYKKGALEAVRRLSQAEAPVRATLTRKSEIAR
jgi:hypothetical protein